jgi:outer membrane protein assembly factor BamB
MSPRLRSSFISALVASVIIQCPQRAFGGEKENQQSIDVTGEVKDWNSAKYAAPPTEFRQGNATIKAVNAHLVERTENGFTVNLPSGAPIPTPTVYGGRVYVSGGFHSKEFYCFAADTGKPIWRIELDDDGPTSAVCEDGIAVFNTESCTIFAVSTATGRMLWSHWLGDPLTSTPTIAGGRVYSSYPARGRGAVQDTPGASAIKKSLDKKRKKKQGVKKAPPTDALAGDDGAEIRPTPVKTFPPASHVLACFDLKTGRILWQRWIDSDVMTAPIAVDSDLYLTSFNGTVYRFRQDDGAILFAERSRATSAPVVVAGMVHLTKRADSDGVVGEAVAAYDLQAAREKFQGAARGAAYLDATVQSKSAFKVHAKSLDASNGFGFGAPAAANAEAAAGNIGQDNVSSLQAFQGSRILNCRSGNVSCMGDELVCTDATSGQRRWSLKLNGDLAKDGGFLGSPPAAAGNQIFLATLKGEVLQVDPAEGKVQKRYAIGSPVRFQPAIDGGRIYVGTQDGKLVCVDTGDPRFSGWTTWGGNAAHSGVAPDAK